MIRDDFFAFFSWLRTTHDPGLPWDSKDSSVTPLNIRFLDVSTISCIFNGLWPQRHPIYHTQCLYPSLTIVSLCFHGQIVIGTATYHYFVNCARTFLSSNSIEVIEPFCAWIRPGLAELLLPSILLLLRPMWSPRSAPAITYPVQFEFCSIFDEQGFKEVLAKQKKS